MGKLLDYVASYFVVDWGKVISRSQDYNVSLIIISLKEESYKRETQYIDPYYFDDKREMETHSWCIIISSYSFGHLLLL